MLIVMNKTISDNDILKYKDGDMFVNCMFDGAKMYPHIYTSIVPIHNGSSINKMDMRLGDVYIQAPTNFIKFYGIPTLSGIIFRFTLDGRNLLILDTCHDNGHSELDNLNLHNMMWNVISNILIDFKIRYERERSIYFDKKY